MTLIIGIKCSNGIVMGADGAATLAVLGQPTIRQETTKLDIVENRVIVGVSGPVGLGQRIRAEIQTLWKDGKLTNKKPVEAMKIMREALWEKHLGPELHIGESAKGAIGPLAVQGVLTSTLVALPLHDGSAPSPSLIQFDYQGAPEEATDSLPFVSIGSGQQIADPFLAFLRRIFWQKGSPTVQDGIFTVLWTLEHAIQTNPGGVAEPKQLVILENVEKAPKATPNWRPRQVPSEEFEEHIEAIRAHEESLRDFHRLGSGTVREDMRPPSPQ
jgi:20S proteasome alpha/beta subunit